MHPTHVALNKVTPLTDAWLYGMHRTCAETAAVSRGTNHTSNSAATNSVAIQNTLCEAAVIESE